MRNNFDLGAIMALAFVICAVGMSAKAGTSGARPPAAKKIPAKLEKHGDVRIDDYYWLKQRDTPEVMEYLKAENSYTEAMTAHTKDFSDKLFSEIKSRIKQDDSTVPDKLDDYYYYTRFEQGKEYPIYCRKKGNLDAAEEILLNVNEMAQGRAFYQVRGPFMSANHNLLAYAVDTGGRRIYTIYFKNLLTGQTPDDVISGVTGNMAWANDNKTLFYSKQDPETLRWNRILRHTLGGKQDQPVYEEKDETFDVSISKSKTKKYLFMRIEKTLSTEYRMLEADNPSGEFRIFYPRQPKLEYSVVHAGDRFYVLNNDDAKNFKISETPEDKTGKENWKDVISRRADVLIEDMDAFEGHLVAQEKKAGLTDLHVLDRGTGKEHYLQFEEPAYSAAIGSNLEYKTAMLRYDYESLATPRSVYDYDMNTGEKTLKKRKEVLGGFKPEDYKTERLFAPAPDGTQIPVSIVYRKDMKRDGGNPLYITSYGSYGISSDPYFSSNRVTLLDRGFVYALPHIRGGSEMGRWWYEDGKLLKKKNTFTDFIAATEYLLKEKYALAGHIYAEGGSAGGLLMGAVANMRPDLYNGIIADVPFVDIVTTMLDTSIPLTTGEYDEWGNPNDKVYYEYMLSYSPYDNVHAQAYPNMLVTAGLNDSQVQYWEPAKWAAKLRAVKTDNNLLLLKTDMEVGHGGKSGRFEALKLLAFEYAFILDLEGIAK